MKIAMNPVTGKPQPGVHPPNADPFEGLLYDRFPYYPDASLKGKEEDKKADVQNRLRSKRAWLVKSAWETIENVCKISSSVSVNKLQCELIADHFRSIAQILEELGLGKDFVGGQALDGSSGSKVDLTFDEKRFSDIAKTFGERHPGALANSSNILIGVAYDESGRLSISERYNERQFRDSVRSSGSKYLRSGLIFYFKYNSRECFMDINRALVQDITVEHHLDLFLYYLLNVLQTGEDLVTFHSRWEGDENAVVEKTGLRGETFVKIHIGLHLILWFYSFLPKWFKPGQDDSFISVTTFRTLTHYLDSNWLGVSGEVHIFEDEILNVELATALSKTLERPDSGLKILNYTRANKVSQSWNLSKPNQQGITQTSKYLSIVIAALGRSVQLTHLDIKGMLEGEVHELCRGVAVNRSLKTFRLLVSTGISPEGAASLGAMLAENCTLEELFVENNILCAVGMKHLMRPLMANKDGEPHVNISLKRLHIGRINIGGRTGGVDVVAQTLRTNKMLTHLSMRGEYLKPDEACKILHSLENNRTLQVLDLSRSTGFDNAKGLLHRPYLHHARDFDIAKGLLHIPYLHHRRDFDDTRLKGVFVDLLVNYNFTLKFINLCGYAWEVGTPIDIFIGDSSREDIWDLVGDFTEFSAVRSEHEMNNSKQDMGLLQPKSSEGLALEVCGSSLENKREQYQIGVEVEDKRCLLDLIPHHNIILSHSEEEKEFAKGIYMGLKSSNQNVIFDQDSNNNIETAKQCELAVVVLSKSYLTSKKNMLELSTFMNGSTLKVFPLFYNLTPFDLDESKKLLDDCKKSWKLMVEDGTIQEEDCVLWQKAVKILSDTKQEELKKTQFLLEKLLTGMVNPGEFCELFSEVVLNLWPCGGLDFAHYGNSEVKYSKAAIEEICDYISVIKCNTDDKLGYQQKFELQAKLSLRKMNPVWERSSKFERNFLFRRQMNKAQFIQDNYIQWNSFEEPYFVNVSKEKYSKERSIAASFPKMFLYHFKAQMLQNYPSKDFLRMLKRSADVVAEKMHSQTFKFSDSVPPNAGLMSLPRKTIAICQDFSGNWKEIEGDMQPNNSKQYVIVQDGLTGAYHYQSNEAMEQSKQMNLAEPIVNKSAGVIGVKVTSTEINVEMMWEDGSYYSGALEDFSYELNLDKNKQCAIKVFGDLEGASFLSKNCGIKCSPLLIIALARAVGKKGLILTWSNGKGHMEIDPKLGCLKPTESVVYEYQILYTSNINQLGDAVEWGTSSNYNHSAETDTGKIVVDQRMDQSNITSSDYNEALQAETGKYGISSNDKTKFNIGVKVAGTGGDLGFEIPSSRGRQNVEQSHERIQEIHWRRMGGFKEKRELDEKHIRLKEQLRQGTLHAANLNYLVVFDNVKQSHVSIFCLEEDNLEWVTDVFLEGGSNERDNIFKRGLKGMDLTVKRSGNTFTNVRSGASRTGFFSFFRDPIENKAIIAYMKEVTQLGPISNNEWKCIIGDQEEKYSMCTKYWWEASAMQAIIFSRARYSSGGLLTTRTSKDIKKIEKELHPKNKERSLTIKDSKDVGRIGYCTRNEFTDSEKYVHMCLEVTSRGRFSKVPASVSIPRIKWGGILAGWVVGHDDSTLRQEMDLTTT